MTFLRVADFLPKNEAEHFIKCPTPVRRLVSTAPISARYLSAKTRYIAV
jgi:hypothetical protein